MKLVNTLIGLLAPHQCVACGIEGSVLCGACLDVAGSPIPGRCVGCHSLSKNYQTCTTCKKWLPIKAVYVSNPLEGAYAELIRAFKFDCKRQASKPLAVLMAEVVPEHTGLILCPLPTAPARIRERGFDHTKLLADEFQKEYKFTLTRCDALHRRSNTRQLGANRTKRIEQMKDEFYVLNPQLIKGKEILLLDDVVTTGASLAAAAKTLKEAGAANIYAVTFAQKM